MFCFHERHAYHEGTYFDSARNTIVLLGREKTKKCAYLFFASTRSTNLLLMVAHICFREKHCCASSEREKIMIFFHVFFLLPLEAHIASHGCTNVCLSKIEIDKEKKRRCFWLLLFLPVFCEKRVHWNLLTSNFEYLYVRNPTVKTVKKFGHVVQEIKH